METFKDNRFLRQLNNYGGLIKDMGHIDIINNHSIIVRSAKDSINHLYEYETIVMEFDIENNISKKHH